MDSDALFHLLGIRLEGVHDTQACSSDSLGLNATLEWYGLPATLTHNKPVYRDQPAYWGTRPLTATMVAWASEDVRCLFPLYDAQARDPTFPSFPHQTRLREYRDAVVEVVNLRGGMAGRFVGRQGERLRWLKHHTGAQAYQITGTLWALYSPNKNSARRAKERIHMFLEPQTASPPL